MGYGLSSVSLANLLKPYNFYIFCKQINLESAVCSCCLLYKYQNNNIGHIVNIYN